MEIGFHLVKNMSNFLTKKAFEIWVKNHLGGLLTGGGGATPTAKHGPTHEELGSDPVNILNASVIVTGTLNGDRLPAISTTKKGAVPAVTPASPSEFLRDTGDFEHIVQADVGGLEITATPQFAGLGIKIAGSDNMINLIEGAQVGIASGPRQIFYDADKLLELLDADVNIGDIPTQPGTGGTWSTSYDSTEQYIYKSIIWKGKLYVGSYFGNYKIYVYDGNTWGLAATLATGIYSFCIHNDKLFVGGSGGKIYVTSDGINWPETAADLAGKLNTINEMLSRNGILWVTGSMNGAPVYYTINDGATWTLSLTPNPVAYYANNPISFLGNIYVGVVESSSDAARAWIYKWNGTSWSIVYTHAGPQGFGASIVWNDKLYFGGTVGRIYVSSDGDNFTLAVDLGSAGKINSFAEYNAKLLVACSDKIYETSNGTDWTLFYDSTEAVIYSLVLYGTGLYAGTGNAGKILAYIDNTYIPAPNLKLFGHETLWGQFRPGNAAGIKGSLLLSDAPNYNKWLPPGIDGQYIAAPATPGDDPVYQVIPASDIVNTPAGTIAAINVQTALNELDTEKQSIVGMDVAVAASFQAAVISHLLCYDGDILTYENEVLYG
jgi:hypothetical protein